VHDWIGEEIRMNIREDFEDCVDGGNHRNIKD
jgi:hypothetical protein